MSSEPMLRDQCPLELPLEGGGSLLLKYCKEAASPGSEPLPIQPEEGQKNLGDLQDLARKGTLQEFVEVWLREDDVRWEIVCRNKITPDEQALAVFQIYNRQGKEGLKRLREWIKAYQRFRGDGL